MPTVKSFNQLLKNRKARWRIPSRFSDDLDISVLSQRFPLGRLAPPPGALNARFPRVRRPKDSPFRRLIPRFNRLTRALTPEQPSSWDWRDVEGENWLSPVRNQGGCGSCVAFAITGAFETHYRIEKNRPNDTLDASEASLFFTSNRQCDVGDPRYGWWIDRGLDALIDEGICPEEQYPYRDDNHTATLVDGGQRTFKISGYDSTTNSATMKRWLIEEGPLVASFTVFQDFFTYWNSGAEGVYEQVSGPRRGGHAVTVIGFDDDENCWICRNSWGSTRGNDGCFRMGYGECNIDDRMYLMEDIHETFSRDEIRYDPRRLRIVKRGNKGWLLTDGTQSLKLLDSAEDARNALRVARRHTRMGFVGRDNERRNRRSYIMEYWTGNSGLSHQPLTQTDSINYRPANVVAEDKDSRGWQIKSGRSVLQVADNIADALAMMNIIERHSRICFIGRDNQRRDRKRYIMTYWE